LTDVKNCSNGSTGILNIIEIVCIAVNMAVVFAMMLVVIYGVVGRYFFNTSANWVAEVSAFMMVPLTFLALGHVQSKRMHVNITLLIDKQSLKTKTVLRIITTLFTLALFALLTWAAWLFSLEALQHGYVSDAAGIPLFPFRLLVPVGSLLMCVRLVADLVQDIGPLIGHGSLKPL
jgi:TRAP-type C4-dicarboxylate transport system permease small subunit